MIQKGLAVAVFFFFLEVCIIPSATSERINGTIPMNSTKIITVDDEPGDADFTSIKEAVNSSSPGDTIEVYSGTYLEQGIHIVNDNITLLGISHELGEGDDSGMPCIKGDGTAFVIHIEASHVLISNFTMENYYASNFTAHACIMVGLDTIPFYEVYERDNITIAECLIRNTPRPGIWVGDVSRNIRIVHNELHNCTIGILSLSVTHRFMARPNITGNLITDCSLAGIDVDDTLQNISGNTIQRCEIGLLLYPAGVHNIVYGNDFENCPIGVKSLYGQNTITKNNFKNYSWIGSWFDIDVNGLIPVLGWIFYLQRKDTWVGNYWDSWKGSGAKTILGQVTIYKHIFNYIYHITIPWITHDWHPAIEPYNI